MIRPTLYLQRIMSIKLSVSLFLGRFIEICQRHGSRSLIESRVKVDADRGRERISVRRMPRHIHITMRCEKVSRR